MAVTTITGNVGGIKELAFSQNGKPFIKFSVAWSERSKDKTGQYVDGPTVWVQCTAFNKLAEGFAASIQKGMQVTITGNLRAEEWASNQGPDTVFTMTVDAGGPSLVFQDAQVSKRQQKGSHEQAARWQQAKEQVDSWNSAPPAGGFSNAQDEEPPF